MDLTNTSAIVTGAASGLGAATASALATSGAHVVGIDLMEPVVDVPGITLMRADIRRPEEIEPAVQAASRIGPLRVVVNCAGIAPARRIVGRTGRHDLDLFQRVVDVNLTGTFNVMAIAAEAMIKAPPASDGQRGVVVNTASIAAFDGQVGQAAYASSKGGVVALTLAAARDLADHRIRVCTVAPGIVDTPMMGSVSEEYRAELERSVPNPPRLASPDEFAKLVMMIIEHDYLNGETIRMDGALRMAPR